MKSLEPDFIDRQPITQNLLRTVRLIGEYKGKQELFKEQSPQILETLQQAAIIQSTESSNRIEGVEAPLERIKALVAQKTTPQNRSEQEIARDSTRYFLGGNTFLALSSLLTGNLSSALV